MTEAKIEMSETALKESFARVHVLVVGDVWLERYLTGELGGGIEAMPVLRDARRRERPGGAGHVATCVAAVGCRALLCGLWGDDAERGELARSFEGAGVDTTGVVTSALATASETTFVAGGKRLLRMDVGGGSVPMEDAARLEERAVELVTKVHAVILADAGKGVLSGEHCVGELGAAILRAARTAGVPVVAKAGSSDLSRYSGAAVVCVKAGKLAAMTGLPAEDKAGVTAAARAQMVEHEITHLVIAMAGEGMRVLGPESDSIVPGRGDVDVVLTAMTAALAEKMPMEQAMEVAMRAAERLVSGNGAAL